MDDNCIRVMLGAVVGSFSQWCVAVHRATRLPSLAPRQHRCVRAAQCTVDALKCVAMWMGFARDHDSFSIIADATSLAGAAFWWKAAINRSGFGEYKTDRRTGFLSVMERSEFTELAMGDC